MWALFSKLFVSQRAKNGAVDAAGAVGALVLALMFYQFLYAPWGRELDERRGRMEQLHHLVATADEVAQQHQSLQDRLSSLREAAKQIRRRMPPLTSGNDFAEAASELARSLGLEVVQFTPGVPQITPTHSTVDVACRLNGSFASVCQFLSAIYQLPQIAAVSKFDLETATNSEAYPLQLTFQLYYQPDLHDTKRKRDAP